MTTLHCEQYNNRDVLDNSANDGNLISYV